MRRNRIYNYLTKYKYYILINSKEHNIKLDTAFTLEHSYRKLNRDELKCKAYRPHVKSRSGDKCGHTCQA